MPLSEHEQRILAEIERRLLEEDPKFAHQVGSSFRAHLGRRLKLAVAGFILGLVVVISSTFFENVAIGVGPRWSARSTGPSRPAGPARQRPAPAVRAAAPRAASTPGGAG
jgi:hypothetical protein